eukprot:9490266-Pyramimonas_sp.AAC.1
MGNPRPRAQARLAGIPHLGCSRCRMSANGRGGPKGCRLKYDKAIAAALNPPEAGGGAAGAAEPAAAAEAAAEPALDQVDSDTEAHGGREEKEEKDCLLYTSPSPRDRSLS